MSFNSEASLASGARATISTALSNGVPLVSPTLSVSLGGLKKSARNGDLNLRNFKNVKWGQGGTSFEWRVWKYRGRAVTDTGTLRMLDFKQEDLLASPSIEFYKTHDEWGIGKGDLELNKNAGPQKIRDLKKDAITGAKNNVYAALARLPWNANETGQNGGLTMMSPTNVSASTEYAGIAMNATTTNGTETFYYWRPTGYDYSTSTLAANFHSIAGRLTRQIKAGGADGQGQLKRPDFGVMDPDAWAYVETFFESKTTIMAQSGTMPANRNLFEDDFENIIYKGVTFFYDENFGGSTGYVDGAAAEEILIGCSDSFIWATTAKQSDGLVQVISSDKQLESLVSGTVGTVETEMTAFGLLNPMDFQLAYT